MSRRSRADTLRARRVTVVPAGTTDPTLPPDLAPVSPIVRVVIGADHTGVALKAALITHLRQAGKSVTDVGTAGPEPVDYPDIAAAVAVAVARGEADAGIVIDGAGLGSAIAANKVRGVRAAMCTTPTLARYARSTTAPTCSRSARRSSIRRKPGRSSTRGCPPR